MENKSLEVVKLFLSLPNSEKKRWSEDVIRYSSDELYATLETSKDFTEVSLAFKKFYTEMILAHRHLGLELPSYIERFNK